jgi:hypothetical protein
LLGLVTFNSSRRVNKQLPWFDMYRFLGDQFERLREWKLGLTGRAVETMDREIPELYSDKKDDRILEYIEDEMEGYEAAYQAIKERFYSELMALRERLLK